jgi:hypothetical protein
MHAWMILSGHCHARSGCNASCSYIYDSLTTMHGSKKIKDRRPAVKSYTYASLVRSSALTHKSLVHNSTHPMHRGESYLLPKPSTGRQSPVQGGQHYCVQKGPGRERLHATIHTKSSTSYYDIPECCSW